ncbi:MAG: LPS export ABC transporter periplasmic protein LptC [Bacteroidales bacterium]|nr:LPS export ABC transporter periplasmic protein LptC [Bacteroidales bacterium]
MLTIIIPLVGGIIVLSGGCDSKIERVKLFSEEVNFPDQSMTDAEIIHSNHGQVKVRVTAPEINRYTSVEEPHTIFPQGLTVLFYDSTMTVESRISANYAIYHEPDELWEAKNDVVAINNQGDTLNTEYLVWRQDKEIIYTDRYVRITTREGIIHGKGFEANQDFTDYEIKETTGTIEVEDE